MSGLLWSRKGGMGSLSWEAFGEKYLHTFFKSLPSEGEIHSVYFAFVGTPALSSILFFLITCLLLLLEQGFFKTLSPSVLPAAPRKWTVSGCSEPQAVDSGCWEESWKEHEDSSLERDALKCKCVQPLGPMGCDFPASFRKVNCFWSWNVLWLSFPQVWPGVNIPPFPKAKFVSWCPMTHLILIAQWIHSVSPDPLWKEKLTCRPEPCK